MGLYPQVDLTKGEEVSHFIKIEGSPYLASFEVEVLIEWRHSQGMGLHELAN